MTTLIDAGFIVWGFFALYAVIVVAYYLWMYGVERRQRDDRRPRDRRE